MPVPRPTQIAILGGVAALALFVAAGTYVINNWWDWIPAANQLPEEVRRAKELGLPLTAAEIAPDPPVKPEENAAPAIRLMLEEVEQLKGRRQKEADLEKAIAQRDMPLVRKLLVPFGPALAHAEKAAEKPRVDYHRDWDLGPEVLFPEYASFKSAVRVLGVRARLSALEGKTAFALKDLDTQRRLARLAGEEPIMISMLVEIASRKMSLRTAEHLAATWKDDDSKLAKLENVLAKREPLPDMMHGLRGKVFMTVTTARNLQHFGDISSGEGSSVDPKLLQRDGLPADLRQRAFMARALEAWNDKWPLLQKRVANPLENSRDLEKMQEAMDSKRGVSYVLMAILSPVFSQAALAVVSLDASESTTLALVRALRHKGRTGSFPSSVDGTDPFDGKPLRVKIDGESIRIYSIGRNFKDDGGVLPKELRKGLQDRNADEVASFPPID